MRAEHIADTAYSAGIVFAFIPFKFWALSDCSTRHLIAHAYRASDFFQQEFIRCDGKNAPLFNLLENIVFFYTRPRINRECFYSRHIQNLKTVDSVLCACNRATVHFKYDVECKQAIFNYNLFYRRSRKENKVWKAKEYT